MPLWHLGCDSYLDGISKQVFYMIFSVHPHGHLFGPQEFHKSLYNVLSCTEEIHLKCHMPQFLQQKKKQLFKYLAYLLTASS